MAVNHDVKDLDLDALLDASFDDVHGFSLGNIACEDPRLRLAEASMFSAQPSTVQTTSDLAFDPLAQQPPQVHAVRQEHRLLNDLGLAYTLPDLTTDADLLQSSQAFFEGFLPLKREPEARDTPTPQLSAKEKQSSSGSGDHGGTSKGKGSLPSLAERNKQAQRRHRQRQRDRLDTLESQLKRLNEEKLALTAEKAALAGQTAVLTQVLQMRDEQLQQLQSASANPSLQSKGDDDVYSGTQERAVSSGLAESLATILTISVREDQKYHLRPEQVKAMPPEELARLYTEYMSAIMKQLAAVKSSTGETAKKAERRISELLQEVLVLLIRYALGNLVNMKRFVVGKAFKAGPSAASGPEISDNLGAATGNLNLAEAQTRALCKLRLLFMQKQTALLQQRGEAMCDLQQTTPNGFSSHDIAFQFLKAEQAMGRIRSNLRLENQLVVDLIYTFLIKILSPVQAASCLVQSFPWYPDILYILTWIAAKAGDAQAAELLSHKLPSRHSSEQESGDEGFPHSSSTQSP